MKRTLFIFLMAVIAIPAVAIAGITSPARIHLVEGDVMFHTPDTEEWLPAAVNTPLDEGDAIWTPSGSRTEIQLADGTVVRLDGGSQLDLIAAEEGFTHLHLANGRLYLRTAPNTGKNALQIDADDTTVLPDARTRLRIDMLPDGQEDVAIFKGSAYVEGNGNRTIVRAGEHIALEEGHSELLPLNPPDTWERWNTERDRSQSRAVSAESYLPDELRPYSGELDSYGGWVRVPDYGMVWRPTMISPDDWAPYRSGRWIWKGDDYVWISYESWGWVPYHYGRWAVISGFGWCWVPPVRGDVYWGPGYVGWYRTGNHVGWTPLAPGETFYGRRHYGRHSVNIAHAPVGTAAVTYRNRTVRGGLNIQLQNDFLRGRAVFQKPTNTTTVSVSVSLGSPRIQPVRETRMPIIKQTPPRVAPPAIRHHDTRELRDRFPRVAPIPEKQRRIQPQATVPVPAGRPGTSKSQPMVIQPGQREQPAVPSPRTQPQVTVPAPAAPPVVNRPAAPPLSRQQPDAGRPGTPQPQPMVIQPGQREQPAVPSPRTQPQVTVPAPAVPPAVSRPAAPPLSRQQPDAGRPGTPQPQPMVIQPGRRGQPPLSAPADKPAPPAASPRHGEPAVQENKPRGELKQKRIWNVTTTEQGIEKDMKEKDNKEPRRGRK